MINLIFIDALRWARNGYILILALGLSALGYISILSSYYLSEIIEMSSTDGISVAVPDPTAISVTQSYLKNFSQLGIVLVIFIFAKGTGFGADRSTRVYYAVRSRWAYRVYLPKILNSIFWSLFSVFISYLLMRYSVWTLFSEEDFNLDINSLFCIFTGTTFCLTLSFVLGVWTNSLLLSILFPVVFIYFTSFINTFNDGTGWVPASLLNPSSLILSGENFFEYIFPLLFSLAASIIFILVACLCPLRKNNR